MKTFLEDLVEGLSHRPRSISPKYFYNEAGSGLFDLICELPEYYPTRTEMAILHSNAPAIAQLIGPGAQLIEFGAGSLTKIRILLDAFEGRNAPACFVPIDISAIHLRAATKKLKLAYPNLEVCPIAGDYMAMDRLSLPAMGASRVGFFPGSTIGNLDPKAAFDFLCSARQLLRGGGLLVGVDLVKPPSILHAAYNDAQGVTAAFNLNLLYRANAELGADFDLGAFTHHATYNPTMQRIEMHLISQADQQVKLGGQLFDIDEGESIHTESSHKYTVGGFQELARNAGFHAAAVWTDPDRLFSVHWLAST